MSTVETKRADQVHEARELVCDCFRTRLGWQWVIDSRAMEWSGVDSWKFTCRSTTFNTLSRLGVETRAVPHRPMTPSVRRVGLNAALAAGHPLC